MKTCSWHQVICTLHAWTNIYDKMSESESHCCFDSNSFILKRLCFCFVFSVADLAAPGKNKCPSSFCCKACCCVVLFQRLFGHTLFPFSCDSPMNPKWHDWQLRAPLRPLLHLPVTNTPPALTKRGLPNHTECVVVQITTRWPPTTSQTFHLSWVCFPLVYCQVKTRWEKWLCFFQQCQGGFELQFTAAWLEINWTNYQSQWGAT